MTFTIETDGFCVRRQVITKKEAAAWAKAAVDNVHAHSALMWRIRTDERVHKVFADMWSTDQLIVSYDGIGHRGVDSEWEIEWHVDQDDRPDLCIQGLLALSGSSAKNGGTQFAIGSHTAHAELMTVVQPRRRAWQFVCLEKDMLSPFRKTQPHLEPGDMVLWDSRLAHRVPRPRDMQTERIVAYVCMTPQNKATPRVLARRKIAFQKGAASTHSPHHFCDRRESLCAPPWSYEMAPARVRLLVDGGE